MIYGCNCLICDASVKNRKSPDRENLIQVDMREDLTDTVMEGKISIAVPAGLVSVDDHEIFAAVGAYQGGSRINRQ